jgi:hypothetical protein
METIAIFFGLIAGCSLTAMGLRWHFKRGVPMIGAILSPKIFQELDKTDKYLATTAGIAFFLCILFIFFGA